MRTGSKRRLESSSTSLSGLPVSQRTVVVYEGNSDTEMQDKGSIKTTQLQTLTGSFIDYLFKLY
jgi:hypothetical protein